MQGYLKHYFRRTEEHALFRDPHIGFNLFDTLYSKSRIQGEVRKPTPPSTRSHTDMFSHLRKRKSTDEITCSAFVVTYLMAIPANPFRLHSFHLRIKALITARNLLNMLSEMHEIEDA